MSEYGEYGQHATVSREDEEPEQSEERAQSEERDRMEERERAEKRVAGGGFGSEAGAVGATGELADTGYIAREPVEPEQEPEPPLEWQPAPDPASVPTGVTAPDTAESEVAAPDATTGWPDATETPSANGDFLDRMQRIQLGFIDDPRQAALDAGDLLADAVRSFADDLARRRREIEAGPGRDGAAPDTERLRQTVRRARELIGMLSTPN